ncbi:MAG: NTP transferase domain-containing protein [Spirochaetes bacterium]|nr:NTP transferase domain-containing protein [Spirochaetota bacterium]
MERMVTICVMPAAGASSRMSGWKPLLPFGKSTVAGTAAAAAISTGFSVILVSGYRAPELEAAFEGVRGVRVVHNPDWEAGMLGSIQAALRDIGSVPFLCVPADMPLVAPATFLAVANEAAERLADGLPDLPIFPTFGEAPGHPVYIPGKLVPDILRQPPGGRLKPFLVSRGALFLPVDDPGTLEDLDLPGEYESARKRFDA